MSYRVSNLVLAIEFFLGRFLSLSISESEVTFLNDSPLILRLVTDVGEGGLPLLYSFF